MRHRFLCMFAAISAFWSIGVTPVVADTIIRYYQSSLVDVDNNQFIAYASQDADANAQYKLRFTLYDTRANIATGRVGFTFDSKEGRIFLKESELLSLLALKAKLPAIVEESKAIEQDVYVRHVVISDRMSIVLNFYKNKNVDRVFIHVPMATIDSPLAEDQSGTLTLSYNALAKILAAFESVHVKLKN